MRVINADGSVPEMCGNGLRCVALHLAPRQGSDLRVETDAGVRTCLVEGHEVTVDMGSVRVEGAKRVDVDGRSVELWVADVGNPHAVCFDEVDANAVGILGPRLATHPAFPAGTNVGFAAVRAGTVELVVWERGVGLTRACGTGAAAAVAVARSRGLLPADGPATVELPGGSLVATVGAGGHTSLRGPARKVFSGEVDLVALSGV